MAVTTTDPTYRGLKDKNLPTGEQGGIGVTTTDPTYRGLKDIILMVDAGNAEDYNHIPEV